MVWWVSQWKNLFCKCSNGRVRFDHVMVLVLNMSYSLDLKLWVNNVHRTIWLLMHQVCNRDAWQKVPTFLNTIKYLQDSLMNWLAFKSIDSKMLCPVRCLWMFLFLWSCYLCMCRAVGVWCCVFLFAVICHCVLLFMFLHCAVDPVGSGLVCLVSVSSVCLSIFV